MVDRQRLAKLLYNAKFKAGAVRCTACRTVGVPYYYFVNIRHPVIGALWKQWKAAHNIQGAAGDLERLAFEVSLLNEEACAALMQAMEEMEEEQR